MTIERQRLATGGRSHIVVSNHRDDSGTIPQPPLAKRLNDKRRSRGDSGSARTANIVAICICDWLLPGRAPVAANQPLTFALLLARVSVRSPRVAFAGIIGLDGRCSPGTSG